MFTIFQGYSLLEKVQKQKREKKNDQKKVIKNLKLFICIVLFVVAWVVPPSFFGMPDLTIIEQRVIAIFVLAAAFWLTEAIPSWSTSVLIITILLLTCSDSALWFSVSDNGGRAFGKILKHKDVLATFMDPIIMLFLGGFVLALGASKTGLDVSLARSILKLFGNKSENVLLGFIMVTALFSMFVSNTATAAMMLSFMAPVLRSLPDDGKGKVGLALSIPIAANVGGIGTPIGTPPNAIALKYLNDPAGLNLNIGFSDWVVIMVPFVLVLLFLSWFILKKMFPFKQKTIELQIEGNAKKGKDTYIVAITFIITVLMWVLDKVTGVNANVVAIIPVVVFCVSGVFSRNDLSEINWSVLWMVAGGFALGLAMQQTGLANHLVTSIPFASWSALWVLIGAGLICWGLSNFISNTATATLLIPILAAVGVGMGDALTPIGGIKTLLIAVALAASLAMLLPISTPPNALAHSTGLVSQNQMLRMGLIVGVIGLVLGFSILIFFGRAGIL